jgi:mannosyltransferase
VATAVRPRPPSAEGERSTTSRRQLLGALSPGVLARAGFVLAAVVVLAGCISRFIAPPGLWLDEALSVNISKLPLTQVPGALVEDGSPPLYYFLLHYWMLVFGQGDFAVRALSGVTSVATLPLLWAAGRRAGGKQTAWAALLLGASSPWAIYYGTDTRMYSLMALEAVAWYLVARRALEFPSRGRLAAVALVTAALMYTHYWDLYLVATGGLWALWRAWSEHRSGHCRAPAYPGAARKIMLAMGAGVLVWLPWAPVFVAQILHTGTPWANPPGPEDLLLVFGYFSGAGHWGSLLTFLLFVLVGLAVFARPGPRATTVLVEARVQPRSRFPLLLLGGALGFAILAGMATGAAFDSRYIAVVFPMFIVVAALGLTTFASRRVTAALLAVACTAGLLSAHLENSQSRTQAVVVAADLNVHAHPGDMVVYCPDQLGPAVDRLLTVPDVTEVTFPLMRGPQRVDWIDYTANIEDTNVGTFALDVINRMNPGSTLWLVWRNGYLGFGNRCGELDSWLQMYLPGGDTVVGAEPSYYEYENLVSFTKS